MRSQGGKKQEVKGWVVCIWKEWIEEKPGEKFRKLRKVGKEIRSLIMKPWT